MRNSKIHERSNDPVSEAEAVLQRLRLVPPQHATSETIAAYQYALSLLADHEGSPLWFETIDYRVNPRLDVVCDLLFHPWLHLLEQT